MLLLLALVQNFTYNTPAGVIWKRRWLLEANDAGTTVLTKCDSTEYEMIPPTATSDRACGMVTDCDSTEYQSQPPTATSDRGCKKLTRCDSTEYEMIPPTATSDRACGMVTDCDLTEYQSQPPTATSDRGCSTKSLQISKNNPQWHAFTRNAYQNLLHALHKKAPAPQFSQKVKLKHVSFKAVHVPSVDLHSIGKKQTKLAESDYQNPAAHKYELYAERKQAIMAKQRVEHDAKVTMMYEQHVKDKNEKDAAKQAALHEANIRYEKFVKKKKAGKAAAAAISQAKYKLHVEQVAAAALEAKKRLKKKVVSEKVAAATAAEAEARKQLAHELGTSLGQNKPIHGLYDKNFVSAADAAANYKKAIEAGRVYEEKMVNQKHALHPV
jgi:hypothetical protein